jgi:hypothetical protein
MALKANAYVTTAEAAAWLKIKPAKLDSASPDYDSQLNTVIELLINMSCTRVETIIGTTVIAKQYIDDYDGNNSNVIVPHMWPVVQIVDLNIDILRKFDSVTSIDKVNYFLRGQADKRQASTDVDIRIVGQDIVIRDDNEKFILGRIFLGSSLGSIRMTYKAGWALAADDVPDDLKMATLQLIEYFYLMRDNRDLNIKSKNVKGDSYSTREDIPSHILDMLIPYKDVSLGSHSNPQRNTFKI